MPSRNFSGFECTSSGLMNTSVDPHQQVTRRDSRFAFLKCAISSLICSASPYLFVACLTCEPSSFFTRKESSSLAIDALDEEPPLLPRPYRHCPQKCPNHRKRGRACRPAERIL